MANSSASNANEGRSLSEQIIEKDRRYGAHNYDPIPVVLSRGKGSSEQFFAYRGGDRVRRVRREGGRESSHEQFANKCRHFPIKSRAAFVGFNRVVVS